MASIGRKLEKKGVIAMTLLTLVLIGTGCEDSIDNPAVRPSEGKTVEVSFHIGFADEVDGYTVDTKSGTSTEKGAFSYELQPHAITKGDVSVKPDQLYNLEIQQYDQSGKRIGGMPSAVTQQTGSAINLSLAENHDCQLVIVAWGDGNASPRLGTSNKLEDIQKLSIDASVINNIPTDNMNKMPYILHLEHVKVSSGKLQSVDGKDARLLLKRLAARLTLNWSYSYGGYTLNQILLESIPTNYNVIPKPDGSDKTYPSLLDQFTTIQVDPSGKSSYSCWIPANVRGTNPAATSQTYRIKSNAPTGSSYASFIAVNGEESKKKLNYRVYLGGRTTFDFNLYNNTNYNYEVNFNHTGLPTNDRRVTIIDPIPASENNNNLVPTANCFMVAPGGAFCFNPYKYEVNGEPTENTMLKGWCESAKIQSVKVLWQTKENGDIGDPVLGVVNSSDDHKNIVDLINGDDFDKARIYCRVAPNTTGGSGIIAAYDKDNNILWSWHIWVTDYSPDATGNKDVQLPESKRKLKFSRSDLPDQLPMMDRNLGAMAGYTTVPPNPLEISKTNGYHYQWGRKDPFRSSYTAEKNVSNITVPAPNTAPVKNLLSLYQPDGISYYPVKIKAQKVSYRTAYENPDILYKMKGNETQWNSGDPGHALAWGTNDNKGLHDPCPVGWCICSIENYKPFFTNTDYNRLNLSAINDPINDGGYLIVYERSTNKTTYLRLPGYWIGENQFTRIGTLAYYWPREKGSMLRLVVNETTSLIGSEFVKEAMPVRCIQERE